MSSVSSLLDTAASTVVLLAGTYLMALGALCAARPAAAARFLGRFASTPLLHGIEIAVRVVIGAALLRCAGAMHVPAAFRAAGWILLLTSAVLALVPWRLHARFAQAAVPRATRHLPLLAAGSLLGGAVVIWAWSARGIQ